MILIFQMQLSSCRYQRRVLDWKTKSRSSYYFNFTFSIDKQSRHYRTGIRSPFFRSAADGNTANVGILTDSILIWNIVIILVCINISHSAQMTMGFRRHESISCRMRLTCTHRHWRCICLMWHGVCCQSAMLIEPIGWSDSYQTVLSPAPLTRCPPPSTLPSSSSANAPLFSYWSGVGLPGMLLRNPSQTHPNLQPRRNLPILA